jgi:hypothetical protein
MQDRPTFRQVLAGCAPTPHGDAARSPDENMTTSEPGLALDTHEHDRSLGLGVVDTVTNARVVRIRRMLRPERAALR